MRAATVRGFARNATAGVFSEINEAFNPRSLPNLAAWFDALDTRTMLAGDGSVITDGGAVALWADKSGNSGVNCLVLPGVSGNYASAPDAAAIRFSTAASIVIKAEMDNWTASSFRAFVARSGANFNTNASYSFGLTNTNKLRFLLTIDGVNSTGYTCTDAVTYAAYSTQWLRADFVGDNGAGASYTEFYSSPDGSTWTLIEKVTVASTRTIFAGTSALNIGGYNSGTQDVWAGRVYYARLAATYAGADVLTVDFSTPTKKLANGDTFVCATGQTVTLNSSGATGARIAGERDYYQGTLASRGLYDAAGRFITTDGSDDYYKQALYSLPQPVTLYAIMEQLSWTSGDYLIDGSASDTLALIQTNSTPQLNISAGSSVAANTGLATATKALVTIVSNGASSLLSINRLAPTTGNAGAGVPNGTTLASKGTAGSYGHARWYELAIYRAAHDQATRHRWALYAGRKCGFAV
jgi:hypothetical protein